jgi:hypothetical protein
MQEARANTCSGICGAVSRHPGPSSMVGPRNIMMTRDSPDPSVAEGEHMHNLQQLLKERGKDRIRQQEREGEHKYACARRACASEIEMNGKSAKERGQDGKSERASFFVRVRVSIYPHARAQSLKHTHTRHLTCCFLS